MRGQKINKKFVLGLTGSFGSGKTTVAKMFKSFGTKVINADKISHSLLRPQKAVYKKIVKVFGKEILNKDRTVNRRQLGKIVFSDKDLADKLNRIMHPEIIRIIKKKISEIKKGIVILDAPLILETGQIGLVDKLAVVKTTIASQILRIQKRSAFALLDSRDIKGFTKKELLDRIRFQMPLKKKLRLADFVIDNSGTTKETKRQVKEIFNKCYKTDSISFVTLRRRKRWKS